MENHELFINKIIQKVNEAANSNVGITLSADEVKELNKESDKLNREESK